MPGGYHHKSSGLSLGGAEPTTPDWWLLALVIMCFLTIAWAFLFWDRRRTAYLKKQTELLKWRNHAQEAISLDGVTFTSEGGFVNNNNWTPEKLLETWCGIVSPANSQLLYNNILSGETSPPSVDEMLSLCYPVGHNAVLDQFMEALETGWPLNEVREG